MGSARISDYQIVEIVKQGPTTSMVREITSYSDRIFRVKNSELKEDKIVVLGSGNIKTATLVINIKHPEWGVKAFNYAGQPLRGGDFCHTVGTGSNGSLLHNDELKFWRVIK